MCKNQKKNTLRGCLSSYVYWFWFVTLPILQNISLTCWTALKSYRRGDFACVRQPTYDSVYEESRQMSATFLSNVYKFFCTWSGQLLSGSRIRVAHARVLLPIEELKRHFLSQDTGKLRSNFVEDRPINNQIQDRWDLHRFIRFILANNQNIQCAGEIRSRRCPELNWSKGAGQLVLRTSYGDVK